MMWPRPRLWAVLVLVALAAGADGQANWKQKKHKHLKVTPPLTGSSVDYFAVSLKNEANFKKHVKNILIPRVAGTRGNAQVREYIKRQLADLGWDVEVSSHLERDTPVGPVEFHNVIGTLDPQAPRRLVLACHYDSKLTPRNFLGATDSAVPCAQMLNLAYALRRDLAKDKELAHELTLQLLFLDGEEAFKQWTDTDSIYGSRNLAPKWRNSNYTYQDVPGHYLDRIDMFVLLDLIGAGSTQFTSLKRESQLHYNRLSRIEGQLQSANVLRRYRRPIFKKTKDYRLGPFIQDDHLPFERLGVPILHLISYPFPNEWHKMSDNENVIDYDMVENISKILRVFVAEYLQLTPTNQGAANEFYRQ